jgi:tetratricopeptide (TPR) repeat protein
VALVEAGVKQMRDAGRTDELFASSLHSLAMKFEIVGRIDEAAAVTEEALGVLDRLPGDHGLARISARTTLAKLAGLRGDLAGSEALYRQNLDERRELVGPDDARLAVDWNNLAAIALRRDRYADAERAYAEASRVMALDPAAPASRQAWLKSGRGFALMGLGDFTAAKAHMREAVGIAERTLNARHPIIAAACLGLAAVARYEHRFDDAVAESERAVSIYAETSHPDQGLGELQLGLARLGQGRDAEALATLQLAEQHLSARRNREDAHYWMTRGALGFARLRNGDPGGAAALDEALAELGKPERARGSPYAETLDLSAQAAGLRGDAAAARVLRASEADALAAVLGESHPRTQAARLHRR